MAAAKGITVIFFHFPDRLGDLIPLRMQIPTGAGITLPRVAGMVHFVKKPLSAALVKK